MGKANKVNLLLGAIAIVTTIIAIFALNGLSSVNQHRTNEEEFNERIRQLTDTIAELKVDLKKYETEIDRLGLEREKFRKELHLIIKHYGKTNNELTTGGWDENIDFLSRELSNEDGLQGGYDSLPNKASADKAKHKAK